MYLKRVYWTNVLYNKIILIHLYLHANNRFHSNQDKKNKFCPYCTIILLIYNSYSQSEKFSINRTHIKTSNVNYYYSLVFFWHNPTKLFIRISENPYLDFVGVAVAAIDYHPDFGHHLDSSNSKSLDYCQHPDCHHFDCFLLKQLLCLSHQIKLFTQKLKRKIN